MFGITETTVHVTYKEIGDEEINLNISNIGRPIPTLSTYIMGRDLTLLPFNAAGELLVGGAGVCRGYLNKPELTAERFIENPYKTGERLYLSGDLAKLSYSGELEYVGRGDRQVQIRGFRVELGEIEEKLLKLDKIGDAVILDREDRGGDKYLCAFVVSDGEIDIPGLRSILGASLPDYMIPSHFVPLEKIPLTPHGKVDRKALADKEVTVGGGTGYEAPRNEIEEKLVEIWGRVLAGENTTRAVIGIHDNFFVLGGHSLKAATLASKIRKEMDVDLPLIEIFNKPTIRELAGYIAETAESKYLSIEPVEKKEYYRLSSAQKRLYILQQMEPDSTVYNMPEFIPLGDVPRRKALEDAFLRLVKRHESFRTSFFSIDHRPVQHIHDHVEFEIDYYPADADPGDPESAARDPLPLIRRFIRPFDLSRAPLLRVGFLQTETQAVLMVDMHHIISDGISHDILRREFPKLFAGEALHPLRIQYKDFSEWQNNRIEAGAVKKQETYWLGRFSGDTPQLNLPTDYPRPPLKRYEGDRIVFEIGSELTGRIRKTLSAAGVTLHMFLLAVYTVLLSRVSGLEDIVVGCPVAGRAHGDLQDIIGMFVNMLAMRNKPTGDIPFSRFLEDVKKNALEAYENQDYQFEELVNRLGLQGSINRQPLVDVVFQALEKDTRESGNTRTGDNAQPGGDPDRRKTYTTKYDLVFEAHEVDGNIFCYQEYSIALFKKETVKGMTERFVDILRQVVKNTEVKLKDIVIAHGFHDIAPSIDEGDFGF